MEAVQNQYELCMRESIQVPADTEETIREYVGIMSAYMDNMTKTLREQNKNRIVAPNG